MTHWNDGLNDEFRAIAGYTGSHSCIIAGAGTGKSFALKRKVARLLEENESPDSILAVTFTRPAARDLNKDLHQLGVEGCDLIRACTLHSLCFSILGRHEVFRVIERHTRTLLDYEVDFLLSDLSVRLGSGIKVLREQMHAFTSAWSRLLHEEPGWPHTEDDRQFDTELVAWLRFHKAMLIGELVPLTIRYLRSNPTCPERRQYKHIIVDEYQDLNRAEQELIELLSGYKLPQNRTLTIAGDDDQSIYVTLKYAHPEGIIGFKDKHLGTQEATLLVCRRCPKKVIALANAFIKSTSRKQQPKLLKPSPDAIDGEVAIVQWRQVNNEAEGVATIIAHKIATGKVKPEEILVLTPRKPIGHEIANRLNNKGIKAQTCFADAVLKENKPAQEGYAYLTLLNDRNDAVSLRILLGITTTDRRSNTYEKIRKHCLETGDTVNMTFLKVQAGKIHIPNISSLVERYSTIQKRLEALSKATLQAVIDDLFPANTEKVAEIRKLALSVKDDATDIHELFDLINTEITQPDLPVTADNVLVLTLYKAKGLTAKMVVIVNCIEGCIPFIGDYSNEKEKQVALAEQERLFFVSLTRTTNILIISSTAIMRKGQAARLNVAQSGGRFWQETQPSRFIDMLGQDAPASIIGEDYVRQMAE